MKQPPEDNALIEYWSKAGSPHGRAMIGASQWFKVLTWRAVVNSSLFIKRSIDIFVAAMTILIWSPLIITVIALIKIEDGGPIFFRQTRIGMKGRPFGMWKFRSMVVNADALKDKLLKQNEMTGGVTFKMKNDPRVTRIGRFIRKFSIDEAPQLWNVLVGEMSLVGPRPPVPREVREYSMEDRQRLLAKPGLTCFWQVAGRSNIDFAGQVRLDVQYIKSKSVRLDFLLLLKTIPAVFLGKGAY
ncbi:MAG TPA: sugar transferase [Chthoniobacteraceae bacterium]|jgi:lipopolysaccharide/colanic/teichoic acid biosynthesis glycosyltransferase|nr:sugar transferase [Chthoniobacteraceae bacterium]